ncbi:hypothetical protein [Candidatus Scalindua japonica]|nr:hypothetical protein [Candidatus Scalindua japonica]
MYPIASGITLKPVVKLRDKPMRKDAFILDVHLGKFCPDAQDAAF